MKNALEIVYQFYRLVAIFLLVVGFAQEKLWVGIIITLLLALTWFIPGRFQRRWTSPVRLVGYTGIAAGGLLSNVSPFLMIAGVTTSLVCWELEDRLPNPTKSPFVSSYEKLHLKWVVLASTTGIVIGEVCLFLKFSLPFGVLLLINLLVLFGISRFSAIFTKIQSS